MGIINNNLRDEIIAKVLDAPKSLTQEEILMIQNDEELRELYEMAVMCRDAGAVASVEVPDVEMELARFKQSRRKKMAFVHNRSWKRIAAIFVGGMMITSAVVAAFNPHLIGLSSESSEELTAFEQSATAESAPVVSAPDDVAEIVNDHDLIYDNVSLETILTEIAGIYKAEMKFENDSAKSLRLYVKIEQGKTLREVVETLGTFEQFDITLDGHRITVK